MKHLNESWFHVAKGYVSDRMLFAMLCAFYHGRKITFKIDFSVKPLVILFIIS
jgi:hypothetical protein